MAINRGPWNALVDDDGSNLVGSIWNKSAIKDVILDPVDAAYAPAVLLNAETGALNDWAPAGLTVRQTVIYWGGTAPATISGIAAGGDGQVITIKNRSSNGSLLTFPSVSSLSATTNQLVPIADSAPTPVALNGFVQWVYVAAWAKWYLIGHDQGAGITPAFVASDYRGQTSMTWTVTGANVATCQYRLSGRQLFWWFDIRNTTIGGTASGILIRSVPGGFAAIPGLTFPGMGQAYTAAPAAIVTFHSGSEIHFMQNLAAPVWTLGNCHLHASGSCAVQ